MTAAPPHPRLILVAQAAGAFGVRGEVRLTAFTEAPANLLRYGPLLDAAGAPRLTLTGGRAVKGALVGRALEIADREAAEAMRGLKLYVPRDALPATSGEDEVYLDDLIGAAAISPAGEPLGRIRSVADFGAGDLLEIEPEDGASWWVPFTRDAVPELRLDERRVVVVRPAEA